MEEYLEQIKAIANQLALVTASVDDDDLILAALNGLPVEYDPLATTIRAQLGTITMEQVSALLCSESIHIESKAKKSSIDPNVTFVTARGGFSSNRDGGFHNNFRGGGFHNNFRGSGFSPRGGGGSGFRGGFSPRGGASQGHGFQGGGFRPNFRSNSSAAPIVCQICDKPGHSAKTCWLRMNAASPSHSVSPQPRAFVASGSWNAGPSSGSWYSGLNFGFSGSLPWYG
ncbi:hypothetical protein RHGRI_012926 [Rhododendron griersonianum]|uniref:CCHC-type domain-containing protein n=1 Tax=Rhododendron griersonianum TaxID=479676 RepID=A0AAV6K3V0_9ERIC|nr:hypothetical protein RHGRI_012926 [Rhododendron griersonianum]